MSVTELGSQERSKDDELLASFGESGSHAVFTQLVDRHAGLVHSACRRMLGARHPLLDDASQAVFIILAKKASKMRTPHGLASWLHQTTRYVTGHILRDEQRRRRREHEAAREATPVHPAPVISNNQPDEILRDLDEAIGRLSKSQREVVLRHFLEGKPHAVVADELGVNEGAIKKRAADALAKLRSLLSRRRAVSATVLIAALTAEASAVPPAALASFSIASASVAASKISVGVGKAMVFKSVLSFGVAAVLTGAIATVGVRAVEPPVNPAGIEAVAIGEPVVDWASSCWRHHLTIRTPAVEPGGWLDYGRGCQVGGPGGPVATADAPADWMKPDFDDSSWAFGARPDYGLGMYEPVVRVERMRSSFEVEDPGKVTALSFEIEYIGGVAVWLNGQEVARAHLPQGPLTADVTAEGYAEEAYEWGLPRPKVVNGSGDIIDPRNWRPLSDPKAERWRKLTVKVDSKLLHQGVNVLAVALHQSIFGAYVKNWQADWLGGARKISGRAVKSAVEAGTGEGGEGMKVHMYPWPHLMVRDLKLGALPQGALKQSARPAGQQQWIVDLHQRLSLHDANEPGEQPLVARMVAARNGTHSAVTVVGTSTPLSGFGATVSDLVQVGGSGKIPAAAVSVRYAMAVAPDDKNPNWQILERLSDKAPATVPADSCQPIWITVKVPKDATPGEYRGSVSLKPGTLKPVEVRVAVLDWTMPESKDFVSFVGLEHTFFGAPAQYHVAQWSEDYWKHLERVVQYLGQVGNDLAILPIICGGAEDGAESLVPWIKKGDGYEYDWSRFDRYIDLVVKHWGTNATVVAEICSAPYGGKSHPYGLAEEQSSGQGLHPTVVTIQGEKDPLILKPGSDEWKKHFIPFAKALRERLKSKKIDRLQWGWFHDWVPNGVVVMGDALAAEIPEVGWARASHYGKEHNAFPKESKAQVTLDERIRGWSNTYEKKTGVPLSRYGWKQSDVLFPRVASMIQAVGNFDSPMALHRLTENALIHGAAGFERVGADYWPSRNLGYNWFGLCMTDRYLLDPGPDGAESSQRFEGLREGVQEAEARIWLEKNGKDAEEPAKTVLGDRIRGMLNAMAAGEPSPLGGYYVGWQEMSWDLYAAAAMASGGKAPTVDERTKFFGR